MLIFLLRHADRTPGSADHLSPKGIERAELLGRMLAETGVSAAFCSDALRTRETLEPLAQARGDALTIQKIEVTPSGGVAGHIQATVSAVQSLSPDTVAIVVGHSNTVGPIIEGLGGEPISPIEEHEFDKLFALFVPAQDETALLKMRYGDESLQENG